MLLFITAFYIFFGVTVARKAFSHRHHHAADERGSLLPSTATRLETLDYQLTWHYEFEFRPHRSLPSSENWVFDLGTKYPVVDAPPN